MGRETEDCQVKPIRRIAGRTIEEWEELSAEMDKEMAGAPENARALTSAERRWYRKAIAQTEPKVKVTIRLRPWQIERARQIAKQKGLRGYQTLVDQILTKALLP
jgi:predicted DNA binding CopG/RHH family protein